MKAVYLLSPGLVECREIPAPLPSAGEVVVKIRAALTCGTDLKAFLRGHPMIPMPGLFGHEFAGVVEAVGSGVTAFKPGDEVMSVHTAPCLTCRYCRKQSYNLCEHIMDTKIMGAFAEQIVVPEHIVRQNMYMKPDRLSFEEAAWLEPLACVVYGMSGLNICSGDTVLIIGAGPIGLLHLLLARQKGARVIMSGLEQERLDMALQLGAEAAVLPDKLDDTISSLSKGLGVDYVFECTGQPSVWERSVYYTRRGGTVTLFGGCKGGTSATYDTYRLHYDEITLRGIFHFTPAAVKEAYRLLCEGAVDVKPLISGKYALCDIEKALRRLERGEGIKYLIVP